MHHISVFLACTVTLSIATQAAAQEKKFQLALRSGYSLPMGNATSAGTSEGSGITISSEDIKMSDLVSSRIPIWIDAGYMVTPNLMLGLYFQYGFASMKEGSMMCSSGSDCSGHDIQYGIQAHYYFMPNELTNPWLGLGFGRESATIKETAAGESVEASLNGWTYALLQAGLDFRLADSFALGPFASLSIGQYTSVASDIMGNTIEIDVPEVGTHEWLTFGAKGQFGF